MGSLVGEVTGANRRSARAAGSAARQRESRALGAREEAREFGAQAQDLAQASPSELRALEGSLGAQERQLARREQVAQQFQPVLQDVLSQLGGLLQGQDTKALAPLRRRQDRLRQQTLNSLRERGIDENSALGRQTLARMEEQFTQEQFSAQQSGIGQFAGLSQLNVGNIGGDISRLGQIGQAFGGIQGRRSQAALGAGQLVGGAQGQVIGAAGADQVTRSIRARQGQQIGTELFDEFVSKPQELVGGIVGGVAGNTGPGGGAGGVAALFSDENLKENIRDGNKAVEELLDNANVHQYNYINTKHGQNEHVSVMAQELEASNLGSSLVINTPEGKMIDYAKGFSIMLAANVNLNKRLRDLEKKLE